MLVYDSIFAALVLVLAFAGIIWGLRIFKIFLVFLGIATGYGLGIFLADFIFEISSHLYLWGLIGAVICGALAWPLQRLFVFSGMGMLLGFLVFAVVMSRGGEPQTGLIAGATVFFVAGFISVMIYEYFIIILMALVSAYVVISVSYLPHEFRSLLQIFISGTDGAIAYVGTFGGYFANLIWPSIVVIAMFVMFAIYMQKILPEKREKDNPEKKLRRGLAWKTTFLYAAILTGFALFDNLLEINQGLAEQSRFQNYYMSISQLSPGLVLSGFCHSIFLNINPVSFPLAAFVSFSMMKMYRSRCLSKVCRGNRWINGWIIGLVLGLIVLPMIDMFVLLAITKFENVGLAGQLWGGFYSSLFIGQWSLVLLKWLHLLIIFPFLISMILPREKNTDQPEKKEAAFNYCI